MLAPLTRAGQFFERPYSRLYNWRLRALPARRDEINAAGAGTIDPDTNTDVSSSAPVAIAYLLS